MKRTATLTELRALDRVALERRLTELERQRERARLDTRFGSVKNHQALKALRRTVAQAKTLHHARQLTEMEGTHSTRAARSGSAHSAEESR